jgi:lipoate synthase
LRRYSLAVLVGAKAAKEGLTTKTSIMLGLGRANKAHCACFYRQYE